WVLRNKKDERGIVVKNKARLVTQGHTAIRLFLAYASFMGFMVYQIDVKSDFLYGTIEEEVYVCQPPGFKDPDYPDKIYVDDIIFCSTNKDLCKDFENLMKDKFLMSSMRELTFFLGLQVKQKQDGIFISHDKYVAEILRKFGLTDGKSASTPIDTEKPLLKDPDGEDVDVHTYRSMIGSLMYLTLSRPDIMFAVCACARFQMTPKASHLHAVKMIFRYLKGNPHLGLWYPKDSPFNLVAYSDSDYDGASLDRKSTTGGCQFLRCRLISWQCKKQTFVATSSTEAEYVAAASCCAQVLWIQNQLLDCRLNVTVVNDVTRLQALVDKKKVVITEATIRYALRLDDAEGKGCSIVETPLFKGMIVAHQVGVDVDKVNVDDVPAAGIADKVQPTPPPSLIAQPPSPQQQPQSSQDAGISMDLLQNLLDTCTTLTRRVEHLEQDKIAQALEITKLKQRVKKLERRNKLKASNLRRLKKDIAKDVAVDAETKESADVQGRQAESQAQIYQIDLEHADKVLSMQDDEVEPAEF
nr:hypothetical protein [Tanacetum cinerariifolium]